jgi:hypothetical protein
MSNLVSPGVDVRVINEALTSGVGPGTVPLIFIATGTNKRTESGSIAEGTLEENAGKLELITSQRELLQKYGIPFFRENDGTVVQGDETNEVGLMGAYSYLGLANRAYVLRANLNMTQLLPTETKPSGRPTNGSYWFDFTKTEFGIFIANGNEIPGLAWNRVTPKFPSAADVDPVTGVPSATFGDNGDFAVVTSFSDNAIFEKIAGAWAVVGSTAWFTAKSTVATGTVANPVGTATTTNLIINGTTVAIADLDSLSDVVTAINTASIANITASAVGTFLVITNTAGGNITISSGGTGLADFGLLAFYEGTKFVYDTHINVPTGTKAGSIWIKTTNPNFGADYKVLRYNASLDQFLSVNAPLYANDSAADAAFGLAKNVGTLYVQYGPTATHIIKRWSGSVWEMLTYTASVNEPTSEPDEGTLWYNAALESDILINTGNQWRGYRNVYPATDPNGPQMTSEEPTSQSTGAPLANYDLWIKTDEVIDYPKIYRYLNGEWVLVDNTDKTTPFGVVFGDIREDSGPVGPWIKGGVAATGSATLKASNVFIANPGAGYTDGTYTATVVGGTTSDASTFTVVVAGGEVISAVVLNDGRYTALPSGGVTVTVTGIAGSPTDEAEFNVNWAVDTIIISSGGAGYTTNPIISIVGGGGVGATAFTTLNGAIVDSATVVNGGSGYSSIPRVIINTPFGKPESTSVADMAVSDWNDPVALDLLNPQLFPAGMILFNTRRSTNNVKVWRPAYFDGVENYTVGNFLSDAYEASNPGARDAAYTYIQNNPQRWVTFSGNDLNGVGLFGRFAQRICVVRAIAEQIIGNQDIRSEFIAYNLVVAPGYVELYDELITLNVDRRETAFIIADVPSDLRPNATDVQAWATNSRNVASNGRLGRTNLYDYAAMYYPGMALGTSVEGKEVAIPSSAVALRTYGFNDSVAYPWFPPAGTRRGVITNAASVGYVDARTRLYQPVTLNPGQRDVLYLNKINPLAFIPGRGLLVFGDKTLSPNDNSALSRVNVARLIVYLRTVIPNLLTPFLFELNTDRTRAAARDVITGLMVDLLGKEALSDFLVVVDSSNNTNEVIDRNELVCDILLSPTKSINFILVPIRIKNTGAISGT